MSASHHAVAFLASNRQAILWCLHLGRTIVKCNKDRVRSQHSIEPARNRFSSPIRTFVVLLTERSVRVWLSENVAVSIFIERVLQRIPVRRKLYERPQIRVRSTFLPSWSLRQLIRSKLTLRLTARFRGVLIACKEFSVSSRLFGCFLRWCWLSPPSM